MSVFSKIWVKDTAERVLATIAQVLIAVLSAEGLDVISLDWAGVAITVAIAAALVVLKAVAANTVTDATVSPASLVKDDRGY